MTPDWTPELEDEAWKKLQSRASALISIPLQEPSDALPNPHEEPRDSAGSPTIWLRSRKGRLIASAGALFVSFLLTSLHGLHEHGFTVLVAGGLISLLLGVVLLDRALPGRNQGARGRRPFAWTRGARRTLLVALAASIFVLLTGLAETFVSWESIDEVRVSGCLSHALLTGLFGLLSLLWIWRRTDPYAPLLTGGLLGASSGLLGTALVSLVCHNREGFHLLGGHGPTVIVLAVVGAWLGRRILSP